jgi:hypothetical protein
MITIHIDLILLVIGLATSSLVIQALIPKFALKAFYGKEINDEFALFLARAGGLPIAIIGGLLVWASFEETIRVPVIVAALIGKALFLMFIVLNWRVTGKGYALTSIVDAISVVVLSLYLAGF